MGDGILKILDMMGRTIAQLEQQLQAQQAQIEALTTQIAKAHDVQPAGDSA